METHAISGRRPSFMFGAIAKSSSEETYIKKVRTEQAHRERVIEEIDALPLETLRIPPDLFALDDFQLDSLQRSAVEKTMQHFINVVTAFPQVLRDPDSNLRSVYRTDLKHTISSMGGPRIACGEAACATGKTRIMLGAALLLLKYIDHDASQTYRDGCFGKILITAGLTNIFENFRDTLIGEKSMLRDATSNLEDQREWLDENQGNVVILSEDSGDPMEKVEKLLRARIVICSPQFLNRHQYHLPRNLFALWLADECDHMITGSKISNLLSLFYTAAVIGFSGTPGRFISHFPDPVTQVFRFTRGDVAALDATRDEGERRLKRTQLVVLSRENDTLSKCTTALQCSACGQEPYLRKALSLFKERIKERPSSSTVPVMLVVIYSGSRIDGNPDGPTEGTAEEAATVNSIMTMCIGEILAQSCTPVVAATSYRNSGEYGELYKTLSQLQDMTRKAHRDHPICVVDINSHGRGTDLPAYSYLLCLRTIGDKDTYTQIISRIARAYDSWPATLFEVGYSMPVHKVYLQHFLNGLHPNETSTQIIKIDEAQESVQAPQKTQEQPLPAYYLGSDTSSSGKEEIPLEGESADQSVTVLKNCSMFQEWLREKQLLPFVVFVADPNLHIFAAALVHDITVQKTENDIQFELYVSLNAQGVANHHCYSSELSKILNGRLNNARACYGRPHASAAPMLYISRYVADNADEVTLRDYRSLDSLFRPEWVIMFMQNRKSVAFECSDENLPVRLKEVPSRLPCTPRIISEHEMVYYIIETITHNEEAWRCLYRLYQRLQAWHLRKEYFIEDELDPDVSKYACDAQEGHLYLFSHSTLNGREIFTLNRAAYELLTNLPLPPSGEQIGNSTYGGLLVAPAQKLSARRTKRAKRRKEGATLQDTRKIVVSRRHAKRSLASIYEAVPEDSPANAAATRQDTIDLENYCENTGVDQDTFSNTDAVIATKRLKHTKDDRPRKRRNLRNVPDPIKGTVGCLTGLPAFHKDEERYVFEQRDTMLDSNEPLPPAHPSVLPFMMEIMSMRKDGELVPLPEYNPGVPVWEELRQRIFSLLRDPQAGILAANTTTDVEDVHGRLLADTKVFEIVTELVDKSGVADAEKKLAKQHAVRICLDTLRDQGNIMVLRKPFDERNTYPYGVLAWQDNPDHHKRCPYTYHLHTQ